MKSELYTLSKHAEKIIKVSKQGDVINNYYGLQRPGFTSDQDIEKMVKEMARAELDLLKATKVKKALDDMVYDKVFGSSSLVDIPYRFQPNGVPIYVPPGYELQTNQATRGGLKLYESRVIKAAWSPHEGIYGIEVAGFEDLRQVMCFFRLNQDGYFGEVIRSVTPNKIEVPKPPGMIAKVLSGLSKGK